MPLPTRPTASLGWRTPSILTARIRTDALTRERFPSDRRLRRLVEGPSRPIGKARILARLRAAELGHFGDHASVGDAVFELRIHAGPGYRVCYRRQGHVTYWLLCGGDKSTQRRDIRRAKALRAQLESEG